LGIAGRRCRASGYDYPEICAHPLIPIKEARPFGRSRPCCRQNDGRRARADHVTSPSHCPNNRFTREARRVFRPFAHRRDKGPLVPSECPASWIDHIICSLSCKFGHRLSDQMPRDAFVPPSAQGSKARL